MSQSDPITRAAEHAVRDINVGTVAVIVLVVAFLADKVFGWTRSNKAAAPPEDIEAAREKWREEGRKQGREEAEKERELSDLRHQVDTDRNRTLGLDAKVDELVRDVRVIREEVAEIRVDLDEMRGDVKGREPVEDIVRRVMQPEIDKIEELIQMLG